MIHWRAISPARSNKSEKMNFTLHVRNFGPVSDAKISLKPLTIFVGPNNSGKSYIAMLVHSIVSAYGEFYGPPYRSVTHRDWDEQIDYVINEIKELDLKNDKTPIPNSIIDHIVKSCFETVFNELSTQLKRNFASKLKDLMQINKTSFNIDLHSSEQIIVSCEEDDLTVDQFPKLKMKAVVDKKEKQRNRVVVKIDDSDNISCTIPLKYNKYAIFELSEQLHATISERIGRNIPQRSHYLPAARSGILQGHRAITTSIIRNAPYAGIEGTQIPPLSGVVADFLLMIISPRARKREFYDHAVNLESEILNGSIKIYREKSKLPEIKYKFLDHEIPLHRTSSTVSELAPFVLYLKHIVSRGNLLIVEEPEAHLHPSNQLILARHIAKLIRAGLNILVTTHSAFLLEQLSLLLQAGKADPKTRETMGLNEDEYLTEDEVSPYLFAQIATGDHVAELIECSGKDGISQEEFVKIQETLYNQTIRVEQNIS